MADPEVKPDPPVDDPSKNDPPKNDPPKNDPPNDPPKEVASDVKAAVKEVLQEMGITGGSRPAPLASRQNVEQMAEEMVRDASAKLQKEQEHESRLTAIEEAVKAKAETTPIKIRPSTKLFGWHKGGE